mgnify:CR=1 FL=1
MHARICREEVNVAADNSGDLWHKRSCHMSQKGMRRLAEGNLIPEVKNVVVNKTVHKWNRCTGAWEPALHARTIYLEHKRELGT